MNKKNRTRKKRICAILALSCLTAVTGISAFNAIENASYRKKAEKLVQYHQDVENPIQLQYNKKDRALSYAYSPDYYFGIFDNGHNDSFITIWDYKENGYGNVDAVAAQHDDKYHFVGDPSKKLKKHATKYFRNGIDAAIDKMETGNNVYDGPDYKLLHKKIIEEFNKKN